MNSTLNSKNQMILEQQHQIIHLELKHQLMILEQAPTNEFGANTGAPTNGVAANNGATESNKTD